MPEPKEMTKGEREELKRLATARARVAKADADRRAADLKAMFEHQLRDNFMFDTIDNWEAAVAGVNELVSGVEDEIRALFEKIGIPAMMAPDVAANWHSRGRVVVRQQQGDLRSAAHKRIDAMTRTAKHEIDKKVLDIQTDLVAAGLTSDRAVEFLASMPAIVDLMPEIDITTLDVGRRRELGSGDYLDA